MTEKVDKKVKNKKQSKYEDGNFFKITKRPNLDERLLVNFFDKKKYRAIIYNSDGEQIATLNLNRAKSTFEFNGGTYNIKWDCKTFFFRANFFNKYKYFFYTLGNPDPIEYDKENNNFKTNFNADQYSVMLKTKIAKDLNNIGKGISNLLTPKNLIIGLGILVVVYYFMSGGSLTALQG